MVNLDYNDVALIPSYSEIISRDDLTTNTEFLGRAYKSPVIPANMACTIDFNLAVKLEKEGYFYILHRFYDIINVLNWIRDNQNLNTISISVGVKEDDYRLIKVLAKDNLKVDFITIDVAHGHHILVQRMAEFIRDLLGNKVRLIAGNISTFRAIQDYKNWGIDAAKVGLSRGKACSTYGRTGVGSFMFSSVEDCAGIGRAFVGDGLPVIADGGIRCTGDIAKALVAGANMVMVGSMFCECNDSPAETIQPYMGSHSRYKIYYGSASSKNKGHNKYIEGEESVWLPLNNMTYIEFYSKIREGLVSTMSYGNCKNIKDLRHMSYHVK